MIQLHYSLGIGSTNMTLYEQIYKIVKEKKVKFWNFGGNTYEFTHFAGGHRNSAQVRFNDYYAKQKLAQVHGVNGDFYGWKKPD